MVYCRWPITGDLFGRAGRSRGAVSRAKGCGSERPEQVGPNANLGRRSVKWCEVRMCNNNIVLRVYVRGWMKSLLRTKEKKKGSA